MTELAVALGAEEDLSPILPRNHKKIGFTEFEHGIIKRRVVEGTTEDDHDWKVGHPALFPNILFVGDGVKCNFQFRTPVDDETTLHITWFFYKAAPGTTLPKQEKVPHFIVPIYDNAGNLIPDLVNHQDYIFQDLEPPISELEYYPILLKFFKTFEVNTGLKIKFAIHPKSRTKNLEKILKDVDYSIGNTHELVRDSSVVLLHASTSVSYAVLFKKPAIFLTSDKLPPADISLAAILAFQNSV